jgi:mRNA interferase MazF
VLLGEGEADLPKRSVVVVSQLYTVDKDDLTEKIGTLSSERVQQILDGIYLVLEPRDLL